MNLKKIVLTFVAAIAISGGVYAQEGYLFDKNEKMDTPF